MWGLLLIQKDPPILKETLLYTVSWLMKQDELNLIRTLIACADTLMHLNEFSFFALFLFQKFIFLLF